MIRGLALYVVDPGKTTGLAFGMFNLGRGRTVRGTLKRALDRGTVEFKDVKGSPEEQAITLCEGWWTFAAEARRDTGLEAVFLMESFQLRQRAVELQPVEVNAGVRSLLLARNGRVDIEYQTASAAKGFATNERLRRWDVWVPGDHRRDAWRHCAARVAAALG